MIERSSAFNSSAVSAGRSSLIQERESRSQRSRSKSFGLRGTRNQRLASSRCTGKYPTKPFGKEHDKVNNRRHGGRKYASVSFNQDIEQVLDEEAPPHCQLCKNRKSKVLKQVDPQPDACDVADQKHCRMVSTCEHYYRRIASNIVSEPVKDKMEESDHSKILILSDLGREAKDADADAGFETQLPKNLIEPRVEELEVQKEAEHLYYDTSVLTGIQTGAPSVEPEILQSPTDLASPKSTNHETKRIESQQEVQDISLLKKQNPIQKHPRTKASVVLKQALNTKHPFATHNSQRSPRQSPSKKQRKRMEEPAITYQSQAIKEKENTMYSTRKIVQFNEVQSSIHSDHMTSLSSPDRKAPVLGSTTKSAKPISRKKLAKSIQYDSYTPQKNGKIVLYSTESKERSSLCDTLNQRDHHFQKEYLASFSSLEEDQSPMTTLKEGGNVESSEKEEERIANRISDVKTPDHYIKRYHEDPSQPRVLEQHQNRNGHQPELQYFRDKIAFEEGELKRLEEQKEMLKKRGSKVYSGAEQLSELNHLRKRAEELATKRREMQAYIDKRKMEKRKEQAKKFSHQEIIHQIKQYQSASSASQRPDFETMPKMDPSPLDKFAMDRYDRMKEQSAKLMEFGMEQARKLSKQEQDKLEKFQTPVVDYRKKFVGEKSDPFYGLSGLGFSAKRYDMMREEQGYPQWYAKRTLSSTKNASGIEDRPAKFIGLEPPSSIKNAEDFSPPRSKTPFQDTVDLFVPKPSRNQNKSVNFQRIIDQGKQERALRDSALDHRNYEDDLANTMENYANKFIYEQRRRMEKIDWNPLDGQKRFMSIREYDRHLPKEPVQPALIHKQMEREGLNYRSNPREAVYKQNVLYSSSYARSKYLAS